mmetsp:Transcript_21865/g.51327  ORF Transcript_21865/g.51327 Transcript_21865/m.51327 type:complete len:241 (-) Transcript_21865:434-1156(-)
MVGGDPGACRRRVLLRHLAGHGNALRARPEDSVRINLLVRANLQLCGHSKGAPPTGRRRRRRRAAARLWSRRAPPFGGQRADIRLRPPGRRHWPTTAATAVGTACCRGVRDCPRRRLDRRASVRPRGRRRRGRGRRGAVGRRQALPTPGQRGALRRTPRRGVAVPPLFHWQSGSCRADGAGQEVSSTGRPPRHDESEGDGGDHLRARCVGEAAARRPTPPGLRRRRRRSCARDFRPDVHP